MVILRKLSESSESYCWRLDQNSQIRSLMKIKQSSNKQVEAMWERVLDNPRSMAYITNLEICIHPLKSMLCGNIYFLGTVMGINQA